MQTMLTQAAKKAFNSVRDELLGVVTFVTCVWIVFLLDRFLPLSERLALVPRKLLGIPGILTMPFLHKDLAHILSNTFPLLVLMTLLAGSRATSWKIVAGIITGGGALLWLFGWSGRAYVGASALVFGLVAYLITAGLLEKRPISLLISAVVGVMYGWTLLINLVPIRNEVSEWAHFLGAVAGAGLAIAMTYPPRSAATKPAEDLLNASPR